MDFNVEAAVAAAAAAAAQRADGARTVYVGVAVQNSGRKKKNQSEKPPYVFNKDPRYLPNLTKLTFGKRHIEMDGIVMCTLSPQEHRHDAEAAKKSEELCCPVFEIPAKLFPRNAPLHKIMYLPVELLPKGFEAGGIFSTGVLSRKLYPNGLLPSRYSGMTPPLFVGCRLPPGQTQPNASTATSTTFLDLATPDNVVLPTNYLGPEMCLGYIISHSDLLDDVDRSVQRIRSDYTIYVPDLSIVPMMVYHSTPLCVTVLSEFIHPHVTSAAEAALTERTPKVNLPARYFSNESSMVLSEPVHLPRRYLPPGFSAGCVFGSGSLSRLLFMELIKDAPPQFMRDNPVIPPIFIGQWKGKKTPKRYLFPREAYMMNIERPRSTLEEEVEVMGDELPEASNRQNEQPAGEEAACEEAAGEEAAGEEAAGEEAAGEEPDLEGAVGGEEPAGEETEYLKEEYLDGSELEDYEYEYEVEYDPELENFEFDEESALSPLEEETDEDNRSTTPFVNSDDSRETAPFKTRKYETKAMPIGSKPYGGIWFFKVKNQQTVIDALIKDFKTAGIKLASETFDQETLKRACKQWIDLQVRRDEILAKMVADKNERNKRFRPRRKPKPSTDESTAADASTIPPPPCPASRLGGMCYKCGAVRK
ncbi:PREDICTED: DM7 family protein GG17591-like isoform X1 [Drosophila arizonae]|uniref:DM7 family protein GG17591-like isoform X1 n=1 Tax=Drosophila arizonae TaxID=7263 RepID=A0ABM1PS81_DROAR|nr:PREDICTED: DM7 family protein GG17591-like isoform X1 [Drosophila arizonae]